MGYGSMKSYLFVSDFDQTLTFNDSGYVLAEIVGIGTEEFGDREAAIHQRKYRGNASEEYFFEDRGEECGGFVALCAETWDNIGTHLAATS